MRVSRWLLAALALTLFATTPFACGGGGEDTGSGNKPQCNDGKDNDGDGTKDFPDDPSCDSEEDNAEDGLASPQCSDGRDNDGDGKVDYPKDPGCFALQQDSETDDCPSGPNCPQCSNGVDDDGNGETDFPSDSSGCSAASDVEEFTSDPLACGSGIIYDHVPFTGTTDTMTLMAGAPSLLQSATCGGAGHEDVYELRVLQPKVIVATTETDATTADTVLSLRSSMCSDMSSEITCNDDISATDSRSSITASISTPGTYYLIVDSKDALGGPYALNVKFFVGEGTACLAPDECGPGLVCRIPKNGTTKVCAKHVCEDGLDEDGDTKNDFPDDPGCSAPTDDDESDGCPGVGPNCPECGDGVDNDNDGTTDFGSNGDNTCTSASSATESCLSTENVVSLTTATLMGTTVGATNDVKVSCTSSTGSAPDKTYRLDVPALDSLTINNTNSFDAAIALLSASCTTEVTCADEPENITRTNVPAGTYYYTVDGWGTGSGAYTIGISGVISANESCESALAQAGALTCSTGYACTGTVGSRTCTPAACLDSMDNDGDTKIDYPFDPGCDSIGDTTENDPATPPACNDGMDNDGDGQTDYPNDYGCAAASATSEAFCTGEPAAETAKITTKTTTGTTTGKMNNLTPSCGSSSAPDVVYALQLPVPVATLTLDTESSSFDTILSVRDVTCATSLTCDDDGGVASGASLLTMTGLMPGAYAIVVDGYGSSTSNNGMFTLNVQGTVTQGTRCDSPLFTGGASAVLLCPATTTCKGTPIKKCLP